MDNDIIRAALAELEDSNWVLSRVAYIDRWLNEEHLATDAPSELGAEHKTSDEVSK